MGVCEKIKCQPAMLPQAMILPYLRILGRVALRISPPTLSKLNNDIKIISVCTGNVKDKHVAH